MKEHNKTTEKGLSKMEITNLSDTELKTLVVQMLKDLTEYSKIIKEKTEGSTNGNKEKSTGNQQ